MGRECQGREKVSLSGTKLAVGEKKRTSARAAPTSSNGLAVRRVPSRRRLSTSRANRTPAVASATKNSNFEGSDTRIGRMAEGHLHISLFPAGQLGVKFDRIVIPYAVTQAYLCSSLKHRIAVRSW